MFLPRLSGEYMVFTEMKTYEGRNATGMISLFLVVIKNKQMEYIEQNRAIVCVFILEFLQNVLSQLS